MQLPPLEFIEQLPERAERLAAGLVHVDVQIMLRTAPRRRNKPEAVGLDRDRLQPRNPEQLLLAHPRNPPVALPVAAPPPPLRVILHHADHFEEVGEAAQRVHLLRTVVVADADLSDSDPFHHNFLQSNTMPSGGCAHSASLR